jgi:hypothetical protein
MRVEIRAYRPGDEEAQVAIFNTAAGELSKFKPASLQEIQRRVRARDFEPGLRFYAVQQGKVVGYCTGHANGRVSYPWTLTGAESAKEPLLEATLAALKQRGVTRAFAAYRSDWPTINSFLTGHGFALAREMVNYIVHFTEMPTPAARSPGAIKPLLPADVPEVFALAPELIRVKTPEALHDHLFKNPYFPPEALFTLRNRVGSVAALGILITEETYADPEVVDPAMPCFRLGAFGTEGMQTKRIRGLFSLLARIDKSLFSVGMDLLGYATYKLDDSDDIGGFAAQVPSDVPLLLSFYERSFRRQGSFPVFERDLGS